MLFTGCFILHFLLLYSWMPLRTSNSTAWAQSMSSTIVQYMELHVTDVSDSFAVMNNSLLIETPGLNRSINVYYNGDYD